MTPKITLYTIALSQNAVRPEIALLEKGVPFEMVQMDLMGGEHKQPPYGKITPRRQVPTLVYGEGDEAITLYESVAITQFLDDMVKKYNLPDAGKTMRCLIDHARATESTHEAIFAEFRCTDC